MSLLLLFDSHKASGASPRTNQKRKLSYTEELYKNMVDWRVRVTFLNEQNEIQKTFYNNGTQHNLRLYLDKVESHKEDSLTGSISNIQTWINREKIWKI